VSVPRSSLRVIVRDISGLQVLLAIALVAPLAVSLLYREWYSALGFAISMIAIAGAGAAAFRLCRYAGEPRGYHAMLIAAAGWLVSMLLGAVPILIIAHITPDAVAQGFVPAGETYRSSLEILRNPLHAIFESSSCYTTAGFTLIVHEPSIGKGLLYYRSHMVWLGGAGMIVLALAIIPRPGSAGGLHLYAAESSVGKVRPSILGTARAIRAIYVQTTAAIALFLFVATLIFAPERGTLTALFDAVNHAMSGFGTGGVSTLDNGIAEYGSYAMEMVHLVPMLVGMIALPLLYVVVRDRDLRLLWRDLQFRMMVGVLAFGITALTFFLWLDPAAQDPFREGSFHFVSSLSTCGWQTSNIGAWRDPGVLLLVCAMLSGGAAGSTVGGIKLIRSYIIFRAVSLRIRRAFLPPEAVVPFKIGERTVPAQEIQREISDAAVFTFLYLALFVAGTLVTASFVDPAQYTLADVMLETMSAQTGAGMSTGITAPGMPVPVEVTFIVLMWVGRLEIFPVIILFRALLGWYRPQPRKV
jgi:trk system potassium uptake protein